MKNATFVLRMIGMVVVVLGVSGVHFATDVLEAVKGLAPLITGFGLIFFSYFLERKP